MFRLLPQPGERALAQVIDWLQMARDIFVWRKFKSDSGQVRLLLQPEEGGLSHSFQYLHEHVSSTG